MHEQENEGDKAERCDGEDMIEHLGCAHGRYSTISIKINDAPAQA
jgi:hypothetical protein